MRERRAGKKDLGGGGIGGILSRMWLRPLCIEKSFEIELVLQNLMVPSLNSKLYHADVLLVMKETQIDLT